MFGKIQARLLGAALGAAAFPMTTAAEPAVPGSFSASVALTTQYIFRGVPQTSGGPAVQVLAT